MLQEFNFLQPADYQEALKLVNEYQDRCKIIAGGTDLMVNLRKDKYPDLECLIDISKLDELDYIKEENKYIKVGALTNHHSISNSNLINRPPCPDSSVYDSNNFCLKAG